MALPRAVLTCPLLCSAALLCCDSPQCAHAAAQFGLPVGKHVFLYASIGGETVMRAYTPTSQDKDVGHFDLVVKVYRCALQLHAVRPCIVSHAGLQPRRLRAPCAALTVTPVLRTPASLPVDAPALAALCSPLLHPAVRSLRLPAPHHTRANEHPKFPEGGKMSQHLDSLAVGDTIEAKGPVGHFVYEGRGRFSLNRKPGVAK